MQLKYETWLSLPQNLCPLPSLKANLEPARQLQEWDSGPCFSRGGSIVVAPTASCLFAFSSFCGRAQEPEPCSARRSRSTSYPSPSFLSHQPNPSFLSVSVLSASHLSLQSPIIRSSLSSQLYFCLRRIASCHTSRPKKPQGTTSHPRFTSRLSITMTDYSSLKVPELKKLLQEKSLPVAGNKADLIARLQEHDKTQEPAQPGQSTPRSLPQRYVPFAKHLHKSVPSES